MPLIDQVAEQEQEAAKARGDLPDKRCRLEQLQDKLDNPKIDPATEAAFLSKSDEELRRILSRGQNILKDQLVDGGEKHREYCTAAQNILGRREDQRKKEKSQMWREQAKVNQAAHNSAQAGEVAGPAACTSRPEPDCQDLLSRQDRLAFNRNFDDDTPTASQANRKFSAAARGPQGGQAHQKGQMAALGTIPFGRSTAGVSKTLATKMKLSSRDLATPVKCDHCQTAHKAADVRFVKFLDKDKGKSKVCFECWGKIRGERDPFPELDKQMCNDMKSMQNEDRGSVQTRLQPAPLKRATANGTAANGAAANGTADASPMQTNGARRVTARQSAKLQLQKQKEADNEPICIDSDEDEHAAGSVSAREGSQNGAGPALRRSQRSNIHKTTVQTFQDLRCVYPLGRKLDVVELTEHDLSRLDDNEFLNDSVIDFYAKWIQEHLDPEGVMKFHFFNTFFFKKLTEKSNPNQKKNLANTGREGTPDEEPAPNLTAAQRNHARVKAWTKGVDIFSKDFLLIPIHDALHWSLVIVCHPGLDFDSVERQPYILHLDSMEGSCHNLSTISKAVRLYLDIEWQRKINEQDVTSVPFSWAKEHPEGPEHKFTHQNTPGKQAQVPRQDNYHDCGLFVLAYLDFWTHAPPDQIDFIDKELAWKDKPPYPAFLSKHWFQDRNASNLRQHVRDLILRLFIEQKRLPEDHPTVLAAVEDRAHYAETTTEKYVSPAEYLTEATAADIKRQQEKLKREEKKKQDAEQKAAEAAEARAKAAEAAEARAAAARIAEKRKKEELSHDELEVYISASDGSEREISPPEMPEDLRLRLEEGPSKKRKGPQHSEANHDVQDLTGESPDDAGKTKMQLRSRADSTHRDLSQAPDSEPPAQRRSSRLRRPSRQFLDSDDEEDVKLSAQRQLSMQISDEDHNCSQGGAPGIAGDATLVADSQPDEHQPETQDLTEADHMLAEEASADVVDKADQYKQVHHDNDSSPEVIEPDSPDQWGIRSTRKLQQNGFVHQGPAAAAVGWHSALLAGDTADENQRPQALNSEQFHLSKHHTVQQMHFAHVPHHHQTARRLNSCFHEDAVVPQAHAGFPSSLRPVLHVGKISKHFEGILGKAARSKAASEDQKALPFTDPSKLKGYSHDGTDGSLSDDPSALSPNVVTSPHRVQQPPSTAASRASPQPQPFPDPLALFQQNNLLSSPQPQPLHAEAQHGNDSHLLAHSSIPPPDLLPAACNGKDPSRLHKQGVYQAAHDALRSVDQPSDVVQISPDALSVVTDPSGASAQQPAPIGSPFKGPSKGVRAGRRAGRTHQEPILLAARSAAPEMHTVNSPSSHQQEPRLLAARSAATDAHTMDNPLSRVSMMTVPDKPIPAYKRAKLAPLDGTQSPGKGPMVSAQWPADAQAYYKQGNAAPGQGSAITEPLRFATAEPSNSKAHASTAQASNRKAHAISSNSRQPGSSFALDPDLELRGQAAHSPEGIMSLFEGVVGPSGLGQASRVPAPSIVDYAKQYYGITADSEVDAQRALEQVAAAQQSGESIKAADADAARLLQQDGFAQQQAPPSSGAVQAQQSGDSVKTANLEAALLRQSQLAKQQAAASKVAVQGQQGCHDAIDLIDDSEDQAEAAVSASVSPQMQQLAADEQYAREMGRDEQEQQDARYARAMQETQEDIQDMHLQDGSDSNDMDWDPEESKSRLASSNKMRNGSRLSKQSGSKGGHQTTLPYGILH